MVFQNFQIHIIINSFLDLNNSQKFIKPRKDLKKNLKNLFALALANNNTNSNTSKLSNLSSSNKFSKQIKKGSAYLLMIIYDGDKILVTNSDDSLPMIEIDENYSSQTLNNDLQFLIKVYAHLIWIISSSKGRKKIIMF